jgi:hypothetical protein
MEKQLEIRAAHLYRLVVMAIQLLLELLGMLEMVELLVM